jgi:hypothetical protein
VDPVQPSPLDPAANRLIRETDSDELPPANHRMLLCRDPRHPRIGVCAEKLPPVTGFMPHTPMVRGRVLREGELGDGLVPV